MFPHPRASNRENLRSAGISRFIARPLRYTGSHHLRRGHPRPSFYIGRGTRVLPLRLIPQELLARRSPGYLPVVVRLDAVLDSGVRQQTRLSVCAGSPAPNMRGSARFPKYRFLGAMYQIQGYTLHLAALATFPFVLSDSVISLPGG